jgi:hypothetical protein
MASTLLNVARENEGMCMRNRSSVLIPLLLLPLLGVTSAPAHAGEISLRWDFVSNATGYRVYYGTSPGQYTQSTNVGNTTATNLEVPEDCTTYYVAVKAYDSYGESPDFSNEVSGWAHPEISSFDSGPIQQGSVVPINITGANFGSGAQISIDLGDIPTDQYGDPLIHLEDVTVLSCNQMQAMLTVEPTARGQRAMAIGAWDIGFEVVNPDSIFGNGSPQLELVVNPYRADVDQTTTEYTAGHTDGHDVISMSLAHGSSEGDADYNPDADLNGDGQVDGEDLAEFTGFFWMCWNGGSWGEASWDPNDVDDPAFIQSVFDGTGWYEDPCP